MMRYQTDSRKATGITSVALMVALALIFSYIEAIIPYNPGIPGIKLGIANIVTVVALYRYSAKHAAAVSVLRVLLAGLLFTGAFAMLYSLAGAVVSLIGMILLKKTGLFSVAGVSMAGAVLHNTGQILVATFLIDDVRMLYYFPVLLFSGIVTGLIIGIMAHIILTRLPKSA
jgi:heptaprenyl diphosphate synthase